MDQPDPKETDDPLVDAMAEHWEHIVAVYKQFEDKRPVMLYDIQECRIYAYPYEDFKSQMSPKSQASLAEQYKLARKAGTLVVFVRDNEAKRLASYLMDLRFTRITKLQGPAASGAGRRQKPSDRPPPREPPHGRQA